MWLVLHSLSIVHTRVAPENVVFRSSAVRTSRRMQCNGRFATKVSVSNERVCIVPLMRSVRPSYIVWSYVFQTSTMLLLSATLLWANQVLKDTGRQN